MRESKRTVSLLLRQRIAKSHDRALHRGFAHGASARLCFDQQELRRRLSRLERVRTVLLGRFSGNENQDEVLLLRAVLFLCRSTEDYLACLILLKESEGHRAWGHLIDAQETLATAGRIGLAGPLIDLFRSYRDSLSRLQNVAFPNPLHVSASMEMSEKICSVCGESLLDCDHEPGKMYQGTECHAMVGKAPHLREISFVKVPRNPRALLTELRQDGKRIDLFRGTERSFQSEVEAAGAYGEWEGVITTVSLSSDPFEWGPVLGPYRSTLAE